MCYIVYMIIWAGSHLLLRVIFLFLIDVQAGLQDNVAHALLVSSFLAHARPSVAP